MSFEKAKIESWPTRLKERESRSRSVAIRFTPDEEEALLKRAEASGQNLREWAREMLLNGEIGDQHSEMQMHLFTELVGIQMLLMDSLDPLLRANNFTPEKIAMLFRQVQTTKTARAVELLAKRGQNQKKRSESA